MAKALFDHLTEQGVIVDWREPAVIRMAPVPLYNSFGDVAEFLGILHQASEQDAVNWPHEEHALCRDRNR